MILNNWRKSGYFQLFSDYHLQKGNSLLFRGKFKDSLEAYSQSIELNPFSYFAYFGRAKVYYRLNNFEESAKDNLRALKLYPNDLNARGNLGFAYSEQCLFDLAEREFKEVLKLYILRQKQIMIDYGLHLPIQPKHTTTRDIYTSFADLWMRR